MHQQRQPVFHHRLQRLPGPVDIPDAPIGVRRGPGGIVFEGMHELAGGRLFDLGGRGVLGQIQHHQRFKRMAPVQRDQDAPAVSEGLFDIHDRRAQVRHDDRPREAGGRMLDDAPHGRAIAQVQMQIIGSGDCQGLHGKVHWLESGGRYHIPGFLLKL